MSEEKEYICKVKLTDDTEVIIQKDYGWGHEDELNDARDKFIDIEGNCFNKEHIKYILVLKNPNYKEQ